jgi:hypothetical protein
MKRSGEFDAHLLQLERHIENDAVMLVDCFLQFVKAFLLQLMPADCGSSQVQLETWLPAEGQADSP